MSKMKMKVTDRKEQVIDWLRERRGQKVRQEDLAKECGITQQMISRVMRDLVLEKRVQRMRSIGFQVVRIDG
jgi:predicted transcriptional regulator